MRLEEMLTSGCEELGITLPNGTAPFRAYYDLLARRSGEFNLTSIKGEGETARLHFLDSLAILREADFTGKRVIDIGTGAGFPGLPLKLAEPSIRLTLVDSTEKKVRFLREAAEAAGVEAECVCARAEELGRDWDWRESFDICVSRAVARLNILVELCLPLVQEGGVFIAMKSAASDEEVTEALPAIAKLGGELLRVSDYTLPGGEIARRAVVIKKTAPTPEKYPRSFGQIKKSPIR